MIFRKTILIIEDDKILSDLIELSLKTEAWNCVKSDKIGDSLLKLKNQKFECILLNMNLSKKEKGEEVLYQVKDNIDLLNSNTPLIIMSEALDREKVQKIVKNSSAILIKPFAIATLIAKINQVCKLNI